ncbi:cytosolic phospholipase A2 gamma-like [Seriola aureovittata]|uniref:cytosolic phospholipase A2 gamma-like n=1 Tax=Seriola aureovittata TaxID=2871759 RepID=UPI0024BD6A5B|nr:cytosolic phospholipase A2 gamma-like [Seriola aureovittata]
MQTGHLPLSATLICLLLAISGALVRAVDNMEGNDAASEKPIRQSHALCAGEQEYVDRRKRVVLESINSLEINCTADSVPHIALLASGGGQRAAVGLVGSLYQMEKDGLLDTLLYLGGVSGSTWSMSSLYSDPQWCTNMDTAVSKLLGPGVGLEQALAWLDERAKEELFSLTDIWGVLTSAGIMKQMDLRRLSDEASRNATNPYPIYSAIEKQCFSNGPIEGKWFEVSPHEAGFTEMGLFVETSLLGSKFQRGELLEEKPEMDMVKLQGVLGCALAHEDIIREFIPPWLNVPGHIDSASEEYLRVYNNLDKLVVLTKSTIQDPAALSDLDKLQNILKDKVNHNESALLESKSAEERKSLFQQWSLELMVAVQNWSQSMEDGVFKTYVSLLTKHVIPLIMKWEWGTTRNFLYQYQDFPIPPCLRSQERFHLVDAGMLINVAYPPFLGDKRDIDLIIAPEYSAGNMFETLTLARDYAAEVNKPFPEIDDKILEDRDWPKDCYVFEGNEKAPTIVYMPLFNRQNCKDAEEFNAKMEEFSTFQRPFSQEKIMFVLETVKANMKNNKETLLRAINNAVVRRRNKRKPELSHGSDSNPSGLV